MTDFLSLDEQTRAYALVGSFQAWSLMEHELDLTIAEALGIDSLIGSILCKSIQFNTKVEILRGLLLISAIDNDEKLRIDKKLERLGEFSRRYRNVVAHDPFVASDTSDGVMFVLRRPKGKRKFPIDDWSIAKFEQIDEDIGNYSNELESLRENLKISRVVIKEWAASLYADNPLTGSNN
jgi:hypothetical protein